MPASSGLNGAELKSSLAWGVCQLAKGKGSPLLGGEPFCMYDRGPGRGVLVGEAAGGSPAGGSGQAALLVGQRASSGAGASWAEDGAQGRLRASKRLGGKYKAHQLGKTGTAQRFGLAGVKGLG